MSLNFLKVVSANRHQFCFACRNNNNALSHLFQYLTKLLYKQTLSTDINWMILVRKELNFYLFAVMLLTHVICVLFITSNIKMLRYPILICDIIATPNNIMWHLNSSCQSDSHSWAYYSGQWLFVPNDCSLLGHYNQVYSS